MGDYVVSESFIKTNPSSGIIISTVVLFAILSSIGYIFTARKQSVKRIWGAFGIEVASFLIFLITDLVLKISGVPINFFTISPDDNLTLGLIIIFEGLLFIFLSLTIHIITGIIYTALSKKRNNNQE